MRKKSLLIILITIIMLIPHPVKALYKLQTNSNGLIKSYTTDSERDSYRDMYDVEQINFDFENNKITIKGWAAVGYMNNWSGVYSAIGIAVAPSNYTNTQIENLTFTEVKTYTNKNLFGWRCNGGYSDCDAWKVANNDKTRVEKERAFTCHNNNNFGCLFRDIGFVAEIDLNTVFEKYSNEELSIYLLVDYIHNFNTANKNLIKWDSTKNKAVPASGTTIYNATSIYGVVNEIGVDDDSCFIGSGTSTKCKDNNTAEASGYLINVNNTSKEITMTNNATSYLKTLTGTIDLNTSTGMFSTTSIKEENMGKNGIHGTYSQMVLNGYGYINGKKWNEVSKVKMYKVQKMTDKNGKTRNWDGYWVPAAWVKNARTLSFKLTPNKICTAPKTSTPELTCSKPEVTYKDYTNLDDCVETFTTTEGGGITTVLVAFKQQAKMSVKLNNTYIKSGEAFTLSATYTDTITWEIKSIKYSSGVTNKTKAKQKIIDEIKKWYTNSELIKSSTATAKFNGKAIKGTWKINKKTGNYMVPSDISNKIINSTNPSGIQYTFTVTATFELYNAFSNSNKVSSTGVEHLYQESSTNPDTEIYTYNGKYYYTDLNLPTNYYPVSLEIKGLNGLKYHTSSTSSIWNLKYECDIYCYQDYYDTSTPENPTPDTTTSLTSSDYNGYKFKYRIIDKDNPFPNIAGNIIGIDQNWLAWAKSIANATGKTEEEGLEKIKKRLSEAYTEDKLEYTITIPDTTGIESIKKYNVNKNYVSYKLGSTDSDFYIIKNGKTYSKFLNGYTNSQLNNVTIKKGTGFSESNVGSCTVSKNDLANTNCFCTLTDLMSGTCTIEGGA